MKYEDALRKAIACLRLVQSPNRDEAALAAAKAQEIIDRYHLSVEDIQYGDKPEPDEDIMDFGSEDPLHEVCQVDTLWTLRLAEIIARQNSARTHWHAKPSGSAVVKVVGRPSDVQTVRYVFGWLNQEVRRITSQECRGHSRRYQIDFRNGVVDTIGTKLNQQRKETYENVQNEAANPMALVRVQNSIAKLEARGKSVEVWMKENLKLRQPTFRRKHNISARQHGQMAGEQVRFTKAKASLGTSQPNED